MKTKINKIVKIGSTAVLSLIAGAVMVACKGIQGSQSTSSDGVNHKYTISTTLEEQTIDLGEKIYIPDAVLLNEKGEPVDIPVCMYLYDPTDAIRANNSTNIKVNMTGEWEVKYFSDLAEEVSLKFNCVDNQGPDTNTPTYTRLIYLGQTIDVPGTLVSDPSGLNNTSLSMKMYYLQEGNWVESEFDSFLNKFTPTQLGEYKLIVKVSDIVGNSSEYEYPFLVVEEGWSLPNLPEGYLAAFNDQIYNYLLDGSTPRAEARSSFPPIGTYETNVAGAQDGDALRVELYKGTQGSTVSVNIPKIDKTSAKGDVLVVRFKYDQGFSHIMVNGKIDSASAATISAPDEDGWRIARIPFVDPKNNSYNLNNNAYNLTKLTFGFGTKARELENIYFDYIRVVSQLEAPTGLSIENNVLSWEPVDNATKYSVEIGGNAVITEETSYTLTNTQEYFRIKALADVNPLQYYESEYTLYYIVDTEQEGFLQNYNSTVYENLVTNIWGWWSSSSLNTKYLQDVDGAKDGDALKVSVKGNTNGAAGFIVNFAHALGVDEVEGDYFIIRMKGGPNRPWFINHLYESQLISQVKYRMEEDGWKLLFVPTSFIQGDVQTMTFLFNASSVEDTDVYIDYISIAQALPLPTNIQISESGLLTWDAVENATKYELIVNGETITNITERQYQLSEGDIAKVKAVGNGLNYGDSNYSAYYMSKEVKAGYVVDYDAAGADAYQYLFTASKDSHWGAKSMTMGYATDVSGAENGDALKITYTANDGGRAGFKLEFAKPYGAVKADGQYILMRIHGKQLKPWYINGKYDYELRVNAIEYIDDGDGWWIVKIPNFYITEAEIMNFEFLFNATAGEEQTIYIDYIRIGTPAKLATPTNIQISESGLLTWDAVENATKYELIVNGETIKDITERQYQLSEGDIAKVKAVGNGLNYINSNYSAEYAFDGTTENEKVGIVVALDANGGSVSEESITVVYGESYQLPIPTREGYTFVGWSYNGETLAREGVWQIDMTANVTLIAVWSKSDWYTPDFDGATDNEDEWSSRY